MDKIDFRSAIAQQPEMLYAARTLIVSQIDEALALAAPRPRLPLILTGIGASYYAGLTALPYWHELGLSAHCYSSGELYSASPKIADTIIAVSASGRSVEPIAVLEKLKPARSIGLACHRDNPLAAHVASMIASHCSVDSSPNTASFVGGLQALGLLGEAMSGGQSAWSELGSALDTVLTCTRDNITSAAGSLATKRAIDCVGNGTLFGVASYGALLLREFARMIAQPWSTHNFLHGPMEPNDAATATIVLGDGREVDLARDMAGYGIQTVLLTARQDVCPTQNLQVVPLPRCQNPLFDAIAATMAIQLLVVEVAEARGFDSCVFRYRQSDTKVT